MEIAVSKEDAELLRGIAGALAQDSRQADAIRKLIDESVPVKKPITFEEWMAELSEDGDP